jgi:LacI family transcriptional regulator
MEAAAMNQKVTLKDVAQLAGVSLATVSYVLSNNQKQHISEQTKQRVWDAAKELDYIPNTSAQALKKNRSGCIGVAIDKDITTPRYAQMLEGIRTVLQQNNYNLMICSTKVVRGNYPDYLSCYFSRTIDGIIYIAVDGKELEPEMAKLITQRKVPFVVFDCSQYQDISSVMIDYYFGAYQATKVLVEEGIRTLHYLRPMFSTPQELQREQGVRQAAEESEAVLQVHQLAFQFTGANMQTAQGIRTRKERQYQYAYWQSIRKCVQSFSEKMEKQTAVICSWAGMEQSVYAMLRDIQPLPRIMVLAEGNLHDYAFPSITYCRLPNFEAGACCARVVLDMLDRPAPVQHQMLKPTLSRTVF